jgi:DGQHR domain-containing protein
MDPETLLSRCYVLRKDGWEEKGSLYQRMIDRSKIESIRKYLREERRVFINNIIVTFPSSTILLDYQGNALDMSRLTRTVPVSIQLPSEYNSVGLIDGQHRVFSYYEGGSYEEEIGKLRKQQNLLITGIIYPSSITPSEKIKFEATLFLEINATQTNAKSDLKQAIGLLLRPFSSESIAKQVVNRLNETGPLADQFQHYFFDKTKLKTTSVVSYGIRPIVKLQGMDSLYRVWSDPRKNALTSERDIDLLNEYVDFCVKEINRFLSAVKASIPSEKWTADKKVKGRLLTTTNINGFVICLRKIVERGGRTHRFEYYRDKLKELGKFHFLDYRSSQYGRMGDEIYRKYFSKKQREP